MDIFNSKPRKIRCVRADEDGMIVSSENHHLLKVGEIYNITNVEVDSWYTLISLSKFPGKTFNSVSFEEIE